MILLNTFHPPLSWSSYGRGYKGFQFCDTFRISGLLHSTNMPSRLILYNLINFIIFLLLIIALNLRFSRIRQALLPYWPTISLKYSPLNCLRPFHLSSTSITVFSMTTGHMKVFSLELWLWILEYMPNSFLFVKYDLFLVSIFDFSSFTSKMKR